MKLTKKIINRMIWIIFPLLSWGAPYKEYVTQKKIFPPEIAQLGISLLDHLEYDIPRHEIPDAQNASTDPHYKNDRYRKCIQLKEHAPVFIQFINNKIGYGVFADAPITAGQFIGEYTGTVQKINFSKKSGDFDYAWGFMRSGKLVINAKKAGNFTRFINHGNNPNVKMIYVACNNRWHLAYVAIKDIKKGEQLLANYGPTYWNTRNRIPTQLI